MPQMYLRRFAEQRRQNWFVRARHVDDLGNHFTSNVRRVAAVTDFYGERVEKFLCTIEARAKPVFDALLDDRAGALPRYWPVDDADRKDLAWWIAAQIVRTTRQRHRLVHLTGERRETLPVPDPIRSLAGRDEHVRFMAAHMSTLAFIVFHRSWGLGYSDFCLLTGDAPVVVVNGHDETDQLLATAYWDVVLALDPHRFLILPGWAARREERAKRRDHLAKLDGGLGMALSSIIFEAADRQVFCHPEHDPFPKMRIEGPRLPAPWRDAQPASAPEWLLDYGVVPLGHTIERHWMGNHPWRREPSTAAG